MKIAAVTDDNETISQHFGRAMKYSVLTIEEGNIIAKELREKANHQDFQREGLEGQHQHQDDPRGRGFGRHSGEKHQRMFATINDCQILLARGMGQGAYNGLQQMGIQPIITDIPEIEKAVQAVIDESIEDHPERLH
ncbi:MAG: NifB/NifX family molybdenum-iron cluster-binding protein [Anaerolineaceae bacterium]|nr:NifB/NifX family molybdenum-iron cluster-binding protein [Anaerolineaceae bacterium]